ncbi:PaaI family thioesterase [Rhizobiaceae bacterium]|nr:PaaI family thioesterase [Rhizobiaceae bacterium]
MFADRTETRLTLDERHTNRHGTFHGGLATVLLDSACGFAASRALSEDASQLMVTLSFTTNYLAPGRGPVIVATGRVVLAGGSIVYTEGEIRDDDGTVIATGTGVFKRVRG